MKELKSLLMFELKSFLGRTFFKKRSMIPLDNKPILIDLGAGQNYIKGWIHIDFFRIKNPIRIWFSKKNNIQKPDVEADLRYPLKCPDNEVDGVYSSHVIEHFNYNQAKFILSEVYRILKPDKYARIIVPDLGKRVDFYINNDNTFSFNTGCEAISDLTQNHGHKSVWDESMLKQTLFSVGFKNVEKVEYGIGGIDKRLIKDSETRKFESIVIEAQK